MFTCLLFSVIALSFFTLFNNISLINNPTIFSAPSTLSDTTDTQNWENLKNFPLFSVQPFQKPQILFIVDDSQTLSPERDISFFNFMSTTLNYNVTYHDANNSYQYGNFDAIVISSSVGEAAATISSLINAEIPILTMQGGHYDEFKLGDFYSIKDTSKFYIYDGDHYVSENLNAKSIFAVYNDEMPVSYIQNYNPIPVGVEINLIAVRSDKQGNFYWPSDATWVVLDKGKSAWDFSLAPERRAFWGAGWGSSMSSNGWNNWNRTLSWLLYNEIPGNATINVEVTDLDEKLVSDARVILTNSKNQKYFWIQNTTSLGLATFNDIPFGYYNITIEYEDTINTELQLLEVAGERTFDIEPDLYYSVQIAEYSDNTPPMILDVQFITKNSTFLTNVYDESTISSVNLSLMIRNSTDEEILRDSSYFMVSLNGFHYFNDTALIGIPNSGINVVYNISAIDVAGNIKVSNNLFFTLGDTTAPIVHDYNVSDHEDGSLLFYANVTDEESLVQQVVLRINNSYYYMSLNSSGFWIFETFAYYNILLNYSIHAAIDSVGNENNDTIHPKYGLVIPQDSFNPIIYDLSHNLTEDHEKGFVVFHATVEETNIFQSGVDRSSIMILLSIYNGTWENTSWPLYAIGEITYEFEYTFNFNDTVVYRIMAADNAGNINWGYEHIAVIGDNSMPQISFDAHEFGNGSVQFTSTVVDWPNNETEVTLYYTQDYFGTWDSSSMILVDDNTYIELIHNFDYRLQYVWFYATAIDAASNLVEITPDLYQKTELSDTISPEVYFVIENSTTIDGKIKITSWAIDPYGDTRDINNTFYISFTQQGTTTQFEMIYDSFYFYNFDHIFNFGEEISIEVWTIDNAGNMGIKNRSFIIGDFSAPKIINMGIDEYQNGTVTFWAEVIEYASGSGLPSDQSSVRLEYVFISKYNITMTKNMLENLYTYTVSGFVPGNAFNYRISAFDNCNNTAITNWNMEIIEDASPPIIYEFGYYETLINHSFTQLDFWVKAEDNFGPIVRADITINYLDGISWVDINGVMEITGEEYVYSISLHCNCTFNYSIHIYDAKPNLVEIGDSSLRTYWGPVIIESKIIQRGKNEILIWANITDWGSGVGEVILEYNYETQGNGGGKGAELQIETIPMAYNGSLFIATLQFSESGTILWTIIARDGSNTLITSYSAPQPFFVSLPLQTITWEEVLPIIIGGVSIPLIIVLAVVGIRRKQQRKALAKKQRDKEIAQQFSDILSIRSIICRNKFGLPFYTENFITQTQDLDLTAGLTSAVSNLVTEVSQRALKKGEFDLLEREGFSILSHHGEYSTISIVSEGRLSPYMKGKIVQLHDTIEVRYDQENLNDPSMGEYPEEFRGLIYKYLNVGLLSKLTLDVKRLQEKEKQFSENERKQLYYLTEHLPKQQNVQIAFYITTFTSSLTSKGISLVKAYKLLEKCFRLKIIYPISLEPRLN
ncbi:MAG: hypothetical protein EAX86_12380 [Candidatus Heimdallarchaeota archaeon]|nr:hypothetical protein [Candidatus Heimdallarchaeota archaeon]